MGHAVFQLTDPGAEAGALVFVAAGGIEQLLELALQAADRPQDFPVCGFCHVLGRVLWRHLQRSHGTLDRRTSRGTGALRISLCLVREAVFCRGWVCCFGRGLVLCAWVCWEYELLRMYQFWILQALANDIIRQRGGGCGVVGVGAYG